MQRSDVEDLKKWFKNYADKYKHPDLYTNTLLKEKHTYRVCREIQALGRSLGLTERDLCIAEVMALFHDIGRFEQYARYKTFMDSASINHAELGVAILKKKCVLHQFEEEDLILRCIACHNRAALPDNETEEGLIFSRLLRDADKLDIWRVVIDYYNDRSEKRNNVIELGLPDTPGISDKVYDDLISGRIVQTRHLKNLNDFKMLQVGWIYDLNFTSSFQSVKKRGYMESIHDVLPQSKKINMIFDRIEAYLDERSSSPEDMRDIIDPVRR